MKVRIYLANNIWSICFKNDNGGLKNHRFEETIAWLKTKD